ncbi:RRP12-like protein [Acrasis kona]|uniref:RRP12-like protein n=1 Tax=Acrasis kona TaxID=1008807 RepID=A0AAW2Z8V4_9EUKA
MSDLFAEVYKNAEAPGKNTQWITMKVVVDAVTEVLQTQGEHNNPIAYFGSFVSAIENEKKFTHMNALLNLLYIVSKNIPTTVFQAKFEQLSKLYISLMKKYEKQAELMANLLLNVTWLLKCQKSSAWSVLSTKSEENEGYEQDAEMDSDEDESPNHDNTKLVQLLVENMVELLVDRRVYSRQRSRECLLQLLEVKRSHIVRSISFHISKLVSKTLQGSTTKDCQSAMHLLEALNTSGMLLQLNQSCINETANLLVSVPSLNNLDLTVQAYDTLNTLFNKQQQNIDAKIFTPNSCAKLVQSLLDNFPPSIPSEIKLPSLHVKTVSKGLITLCAITKDFSTHQDFKKILVPRYFDLVLDRNFDRDETLAKNTVNELKSVINKCITTDMLNIKSEIMNKILASLMGSLAIKNKHNIASILTLSTLFFEKCGRVTGLFNNLLDALDKLHTGAEGNPRLNLKIEKCIGGAILHLGPQQVLNVMPLNLVNAESKQVRGWLLPLLKDNVKNTELSFFESHFIRLIQVFQNKADQESEKSEFKQNLNALINQMWSLLPGFMTYPTDFNASFKTLASHLGDSLSKEQQVNPICLALIRVITNSKRIVQSNKDDAQHQITVQDAQKFTRVHW